MGVHVSHIPNPRPSSLPIPSLSEHDLKVYLIVTIIERYKTTLENTCGLIDFFVLCIIRGEICLYILYIVCSMYLYTFQYIIPCGSAGKESTCNVGDLGLIPGLGRSPGEGNGYPLQYSGLGNSMNCAVHGVAKSWTRPSDFHSLTHINKKHTRMCV